MTSTSDTNTTLTLRNVTTSSDVDGRRAEFAKTHHRALRHQSHDHLARRRGVASVEGPRLSITTPISQKLFLTSAATVELAGSAQTMGEPVTRVNWENLTTRAKGVALGTDSWSVAAVPLRGNATNVIVVTAAIASGFPVNGGTTTFSDTLSVLSLPISVTLAPQGTEAILTWTGGTGPYLIQRATDLGLADWHDLRTNAVSPALIDLQGEAGFYRIVEP